MSARTHPVAGSLWARAWRHGHKPIQSIGLWVLSTLSVSAVADTSQVFATSGRWELSADHPQIVVPLAGALTNKQKNMINGGFTTVSQLTIRIAPPDLDDTRIPDEDDSDVNTLSLTRIRCSVKFDAWDETYDVARLNDTPQTTLVKEFASYARDCLTVSLKVDDIKDQTARQRLSRSGGTLLAYLSIKQTSPEEASRIKDWLIQQQSGVMQGLFAHMLGELTFIQTVKVRISIPPIPDGHSKIPRHSEQSPKPQASRPDRAKAAVAAHRKNKPVQYRTERG